MKLLMKLDCLCKVIAAYYVSLTNPSADVLAQPRVHQVAKGSDSAAQCTLGTINLQSSVKKVEEGTLTTCQAVIFSPRC